MKRAWIVLVLSAVGCSKAHLRTYDLRAEALVVIQDEHQTHRPLVPGDRFVATSDKEAVLVIEDVRQTRYPLRKGWTVSRDEEDFTIEEIPNFKPY